MDKKRKFSKKALRDFDLIDAAIARNDQNAFAELMAPLGLKEIARTGIVALLRGDNSS